MKESESQYSGVNKTMYKVQRLSLDVYADIEPEDPILL